MSGGFDWSNWLQLEEKVMLQGRFSSVRFFRNWAVFTSLMVLGVWAALEEKGPKAFLLLAILIPVTFICLAIGTLVATGLVRAYYCVTDRRLMSLHRVFWRQPTLREVPIANAMLEVKDSRLVVKDATSGREIAWTVSKGEQEQIQDSLKGRGVL